MIKILMVASEAAPFAKSGGLGDVAGSLPGALRESECDVAVLLPRYRSVDLKSLRRVYDSLPVWIAGTLYQCSLYLAETSAPFYFLECPQLYDRDGYYGEDRKSTRLNSSHLGISYAVFCLKKKKTILYVLN